MTPSAQSATDRGFTLVEILVVVLILAIAAAIVVPAIGTAADSQVTGAASLVANDLRAARSLALTSQVPHSLVFRSDRGAYKIVEDYGGGAYASAEAVDHPVRRGEAYEVIFSRAGRMDNVAVNSVSFDGGTYVTFDAQGEPLNGAGEALAAAGTVAIQAGECSMTVSVEALTGRVTVARTGE